MTLNEGNLNGSGHDGGGGVTVPDGWTTAMWRGWALSICPTSTVDDATLGGGMPLGAGAPVVQLSAAPSNVTPLLAALVSQALCGGDDAALGSVD